MVQWIRTEITWYIKIIYTGSDALCYHASVQADRALTYKNT